RLLVRRGRAGSGTATAYRREHVAEYPILGGGDPVDGAGRRLRDRIADRRHELRRRPGGDLRGGGEAGGQQPLVGLRGGAESGQGRLAGERRGYLGGQAGQRPRALRGHIGERV